MTTLLSVVTPYLGTPDDQGAVGGCVVVKQLENEHPSVGDHYKTHTEHEPAHTQGAPSPVLTPEENDDIKIRKIYLSSYLSCGNWSVRMVTTVSVVENWVPKPRESSIRKKRMLQSGDIGILDTASG